MFQRVCCTVLDELLPQSFRLGWSFTRSSWRPGFGWSVSGLPVALVIDVVHFVGPCDVSVAFCYGTEIVDTEATITEHKL